MLGVGVAARFGMENEREEYRSRRGGAAAAAPP